MINMTLLKRVIRMMTVMMRMMVAAVVPVMTTQIPKMMMRNILSLIVNPIQYQLSAMTLLTMTRMMMMMTPSLCFLESVMMECQASPPPC